MFFFEGRNCRSWGFMFFFSAFAQPQRWVPARWCHSEFGEYQGVQEPGCSCDLAEPMEIPRKIVNSGEFYSAYIYIYIICNGCECYALPEILVLVTSVFFVGYKWWNFGEYIFMSLMLWITMIMAYGDLSTSVMTLGVYLQVGSLWCYPLVI